VSSVVGRFLIRLPVAWKTTLAIAAVTPRMPISPSPLTREGSRSRLLIDNMVRNDAKPDPALRQGAVEGNSSTDEGYGNPNAPAIDADGLPNDEIAIAQDRIGANIDDPEVANADERGSTSGEPRDEVKALLNEDKTPTRQQ
jgi:hypothetical protein